MTKTYEKQLLEYEEIQHRLNGVVTKIKYPFPKI